MKKLIAIFLSVVPLMASAYVEKNNALVRIMNKDAGKVQEIKIPVNQNVDFEKIHVSIRACKQSDPFDAENFFAFVEISEQDKGIIFSNWMNRNEPGENPLQHPDYDLWLVKCE
jgi:hypothetical protein